MFILNKKDVRTQIIEEIRKSRTQENYKDLYNKLFESAEWQKAGSVGVTFSTEIEIDTMPIIERAKLEGKTIFMPKVISSTEMEFKLLNDLTKMKKSKFGIMEPENGLVGKINDIDLLIVPGLAFDVSSGNRLGFGGGYYDRVLKDYSGDTVSLSDSISTFKKSIWEVDDFDQKIARIIY